jgi:hypothetical protein
LSLASFSRDVSGRRFASRVSPRGDLVLRLAGDPPRGRGQRLVLAHRQSGAGLGRGGRGRREVPGSDRREGGELLPRRPRPGQVQQRAAQRVADGDRRVGRRVDAAGDPGLDLPEADLVGQPDDGLHAGRARLLDVVRGGLRRERRAEHRLAGEVEVPGVLEHRAGRDLADALAGQPEPGDQAVQRRGQHVLVGRPQVRTPRTGERDPVATDDHGTPGASEAGRVDRVVGGLGCRHGRSSRVVVDRWARRPVAGLVACGRAAGRPEPVSETHST